MTLAWKLAFLHEIAIRFCMRSGRDTVKELKAHSQSLERALSPGVTELPALGSAYCRRHVDRWSLIPKPSPRILEMVVDL